MHRILEEVLELAPELKAMKDDLPYDKPADAPVRLEHPGRMHACGHDFHTAGLYGAARLLCARREALAGHVVLLFQPRFRTNDDALSLAAALLAQSALEVLAD